MKYKATVLMMGLVLGCARGPAAVISSPTEKPLADPDRPIFSEVFSLVIGPKCATCHSIAGGNRGGLNLETYDNVKAQIALVKDAVGAGWMPPRSRPPLTPDERDLVLKWIEQGAVN